MIEVNDRLCWLPALLDLEKLFADSPNARILNTDDFTSSDISSKLVEEVFRNTDGDIGFVPSCKCGNVRGKGREGQYCPLCDSVCSSQFVDKLEHILWINIPPELPPVLHPVWYMVLRAWTRRKKCGSVVDVLLDPDATEIPEEIERINTGRGFRWFYENVDAILTELLEVYSSKKKTKDKREETEYVRTFISMYRDVMFTRKLPVLHNSLHPKRTGGDKLYYIDKTASEILKVANDLTMLAFKVRSSNTYLPRFEKTLYDQYINYIAYETDIVSVKLGSKTGLLRKQCCGKRLHWTMRCVVAAQDRTLPLDEVILPWGLMVNTFKLVVLNYLVNRYHKNMTEAEAIHRHALNNYDPLVDECLQTYIREHRGGRLPIAMGRNPTLQVGSILLLYIREYKKDPHNETAAVNATTIKNMNADFDGRLLAVVKSEY